MALRASDFNPGSIVHDSADGVLAFAAAELREHLTGAGAAGTVRISLATGTRATDGFVVTAAPSAIVITGESPRGTLNGAYWLLEKLGFAWVRPGQAGTRFVPGLALADGEYRERPSFPRRTLILGNDALHDDWRDWLEFASRNRYNSLFVHDTPPSVLDRGGASRPSTAEGLASDGRGWMFELWDADGAAICREAARRGVALQFGGHHLPGLLSRLLFAEHPDWFPFRTEGRDARYNLCTSSPGAIREVRARAREFFTRFSGAAVYHLWADDITGGGWCSCDDCGRLSPSDQALRATNVLAGVLAEVNPSAVIAHLAYHDTIAPPREPTPAGNVTALYAPRNRNYAFPIDDETCSRNAAGHFAELLGLRDTFAARAESLAVFEYYSDAVLLKWMAPPSLRVLPADARAYCRAGVHDFGNLAVTPRPWVGPAWHAWWFARCAWNAEADASAELAGFCRASFGEDADTFVRLYEDLDSAYRSLLDLGELERIPRHDVLDFSDTPRSALTRKAVQLREAINTMNGAVSHLPIVPGGLGSAFRQDLAVQLAAANHIACRVSAWEAALAGRREEAETALSLARFHLSALGDWDHTHTPPGYANLSRGMLRAAAWHTERVSGLIE